MRPKPRWILPPDVTREAENLQTQVGITLPAARVLARRGVADPDRAREFLAPHAGQLHAPDLLAGIAEAVDRLMSAITSKEKILIYGDYDVDGTMSVVILTKAIEMCGGISEWHVPHRIKEGYGMRPEVVERAKEDGVTLIISVDTGIRATQVVEHARSLGIDTIVTDHHLPEEGLPPATAVINPNRRDCDYPNKDLCGAGVAFKLAEALFERQPWPQAKKRVMLDSFLKLVALATVADVVPLVGENRAIVKIGLAGLRDLRSIGLRELLRVSGLAGGQEPTARQAGFQIGPRINAAGRMESARMVIDLFLTNDENRARQIAEELDQLNRERRETEKRIVDEILMRVQDPPAGLVLAAEGWHRGVVGIVASRVVERFYRPAFVLEIDAKEGIATGSGRSIAAYHLLDGLESMRELFSKFGGHAHAAGVTLPIANLAEFEKRFAAHVEANVPPEDRVPSLTIDAEASASELNGAAAEDLFRLAPFGHGNPVPLIAMRGARIASMAPIGASAKHFRLRVEQGQARVAVKAFSFDERVSEIAAGSHVDLVFTVEEDSYTGWACVLRDVRPAS